MLISMTIGLVIIGSLSSTFLMQRKTYDIQDQIAEAVQTSRAAMDMLIREIHSAGYNPTGAGFNGITYNSSELRIQMDLDKDGTTSGKNEDIIYKYYPETYQIKRKTGAGYFQPFAENIQDFTFEYLDNSGDATTTTAFIRQMRITVTARTQKRDPDYPENDGYRTVTLSSLVIPHNLNL